MRVIFGLAAVFILLAFLTAGCTGGPEETELEKINIAFQEWVGYGLFYLAQEKEFFKEEGMELVFIDEQLDSSRRDAFKQGMLDCEAGTIDLLVAKRAQDTPVVAVMEIDHSVGSDGIVATKDIKRVEDLIGKRAAFSRDDVGETLISYLLRKRGMSLGDVIIIPMSPDNAWQAFIDDQADAVVTWEPYLSRALQRPGAHVLTSTKDEPNIIVDTLNVREAVVKDNPELVKKLMRGWFKAVEYYKAYPVEASEIIAKHYDMSAKTYRERVKGLRWEGYADQIRLSEDDEWTSTFNAIAELKFENRKISGKPDAKKAIDRRLLKELYE